MITKSVTIIENVYRIIEISLSEIAVSTMCDDGLATLENVWRMPIIMPDHVELKPEILAYFRPETRPEIVRAWLWVNNKADISVEAA